MGEGEGEGVEEAVGGVELHKQDRHRKPAGKGHFLLDKPMNRLKVCGSLPDSRLSQSLSSASVLHAVSIRNCSTHCVFLFLSVRATEAVDPETVGQASTKTF